MKKGILLTATVLGTLISVPAMAEVSGNLGVTSNYIWRGVEQANGSGALSGGIDYSADNGAYAGVWGSSLESNGEEVDLYAGYKKELANGVSYDVGAIKYVYPTQDGAWDFSEAYGKVAYKGVGAEIDYTLEDNDIGSQKGDLYYALGYTGELNGGWGYGLKAGKYNFKDDTLDYNHQQVSLTKSFEKAGDFTLAVDDTDKAGSDPLVSVSWKKSFDF
ncbi:MAG TPA: TorF family putative porin [Candidatus Thiothrix moscowensis]|uniref:TorF family putative porin n=1 Tax=unclassified Thiothrix TaxID=2636184 RepID=UPI0025F28054|nr:MULTISPECIES: TorF family putative porin [unclassified Thiothrix]HRJ51373.1 TorF family putative porin [Candidatus Thiothrix moscowensis]HRJ91572.1 TorF family putative porin [Candidatus Thiothrix moscowensis]